MIYGYAHYNVTGITELTCVACTTEAEIAGGADDELKGCVVIEAQGAIKCQRCRKVAK
jgi:hypothetical protein